MEKEDASRLVREHERTCTSKLAEMTEAYEGALKQKDLLVASHKEIVDKIVAGISELHVSFSLIVKIRRTY